MNYTERQSLEDRSYDNRRSATIRREAVEAKGAPAETTCVSTGAGEPSAHPMTGEEYIASIRDGREIYLYGERIKQVTTWEESELGCCDPGLQGA
jgi:hypothetical protein